MATVRDICTDALQQIGVLGEDESLSASQGAVALRYFQRQIDGWAADRLTLSKQLRTQFTLPSGQTARTVGPTGDVAIVRPMYLNEANYIIPGSSPAVESPIAINDDQQFAAITIKQLSSALPQSVFYQVALDGVLGTLTFWPQVSQNVEIVIYTPEALTTPVSLQTAITGPAGYAEAFVDQLALRLCQPFGVPPTQLLVELAAKSFSNMKRANVSPGLLGVDPALTRWPLGGAYNVLSNSGG